LDGRLDREGKEARHKTSFERRLHGGFACTGKNKAGACANIEQGWSPNSRSWRAEASALPLSGKGHAVLTELNPSSHWLAGQVAGIHLFALAGGLALGNDEVLIFLVAMLAGGYLQQGWARKRSDR
jgi:hypothetical protein